MMECFILPNGTGKSRLSVVVIFSTTTIVGTFLSRRLWDINFMLGAGGYNLTLSHKADKEHLLHLKRG